MRIAARPRRQKATTTIPPPSAAPFDLSLPAISKHLKLLERAGLVVRRREAQWWPCRLDPAPLKDVAEWLERYRQFYEESFERLDDFLERTQLELRKRDKGDLKMAQPDH